MTPRGDFDWEEFEPDETQFAQMRQTGRTYLTRSFLLGRSNSSDHGEPARFVRRVFDQEAETQVEVEFDRYLVRQSTGGRIQVQLLVCREAGRVKELWIQRVPQPGSRETIQTLAYFDRDSASRLIELLKLLEVHPVEGERTIVLDADLARELLADPRNSLALYQLDRDAFAGAIASDVQSRDVLALAHRREETERFRRLMEDPEFFLRTKDELGVNRDEDVWQRYFQENTWIFGLGLTGQLITEWNEGKLEQTVVGSSITGPGKRVDAMMRTSGKVKSMVFIEIKRHDTPLLETDSFRSGCWAPHRKVSGGVAQVQGTVHRAVQEIRERIFSMYPDGTEDLTDPTYLFHPRSFLLVGSLGSLLGETGGHDASKILSFELYRRSLTFPEIVTFDELLARAEALASPT